MPRGGSLVRGIARCLHRVLRRGRAVGRRLDISRTRHLVAHDGLGLGRHVVRADRADPSSQPPWGPSGRLVTLTTAAEMPRATVAPKSEPGPPPADMPAAPAPLGFAPPRRLSRRPRALVDGPAVAERAGLRRRGRALLRVNRHRVGRLGRLARIRAQGHRTRRRAHRGALAGMRAGNVRAARSADTRASCRADRRTVGRALGSPPMPQRVDDERDGHAISRTRRRAWPGTPCSTARRGSTTGRTR